MKTSILRTLAGTAFTLAGPGLPLGAQDFRVHEWGTFTTVSASDGQFLDGVEREEEPLPTFVYNHAGITLDEANFDGQFFTKGLIMRPLAHVNVRMETPVVYFYTKDAFKARVEVGFHGGTISQWYPQRDGGEPRPKVVKKPDGKVDIAASALDFAKGYEGSIVWNVDVEPAGEDQNGRVFHQQRETPSWIYPRQTDAALIRRGDETEKSLFYRGLGRLTLPVKFASDGRSRVQMENTGKSTIPTMIVFENKGGEARWEVRNPLPGDAKSSCTLEGRPFVGNWQGTLHRDGVKMLVAQGLHRQEADAMMATWWRSYFERKGLRVFWIVPTDYLDRTLPLSIQPTPKETVRVMVGRAEVLTPDFEKELVEAFSTEENNRFSSDRYFPAYENRVKQLTSAKTTPK